LLRQNRLRQIEWYWRKATAGLRALPDLIVIGAQKGGTTSLAHYMGQHPQIVRPFRKEVHFIDNNLGRGERWYRAHLPLRSELAQGKIAFEASPLYMFNPLVAGRIAGLLPAVKLVAVLRDPTERAISQYHMQVRKGREMLPLREALEFEEQRLAGPLAAQDYSHPSFAHFSYKRRGHYADQLERYFELFPARQLLVLGSDDLFDRPEATLRQLFEFAGVDPSFPIADLNARNAGGKRTAIDPAIRRDLDDYFRPHNERLYAVIGRDLHWGAAT
jgi:hypothetical protein